MICLVWSVQLAEGALEYVPLDDKRLQVVVNQAVVAEKNFAALGEGELWQGEALALDLPLQPLLRATRYQGDVWVECLLWVGFEAIEGDRFPLQSEFPLPVPLPLPEPDWEGFRKQILLSPAYLRVMGAAPAGLVAALPVVLWAVPGESGYLADVIAIWNEIAATAGVTADEVVELGAIARQHHMPFGMDGAGRMVQLKSD